MARLLKIDCTPTVVSFSKELHNPLLTVNTESRDVALRFLRVHLPCRLPRNPKPKPNEDNTDFFKSEFKCAGRGWAHLSTRSDPKFIFDPAAVPSTLYLNPDLDFVYFNHRCLSPERAMAVVHEIRARDPLGVGVCNLALDELLFAWERQGRDYIPEAWCAAVRGCLTRLREVIWMTHCSGDGSSGGRNAGSNVMPWYRARGYRLPRHERSLPVGGFWHRLLTGWGVKREQAPGERSFRLMRVFPGWERKMDKLLQQTDDE